MYLDYAERQAREVSVQTLVKGNIKILLIIKSIRDRVTVSFLTLS